MGINGTDIVDITMSKTWAKTKTKTQTKCKNNQNAKEESEGKNDDSFEYDADEQMEGFGTKRRASIDFEDEEEDDLTLKDPEEAKRAKADVAALKNNDAPLGLLFAAFQRQMASEQSDPESENEDVGSMN